MVIDDPSDPRLSDYVGLSDRQTMRLGHFIAEGPMVVARLLGSGWPVRSVLVTARRRAAVDVPEQIPVFIAPQDVMNAVVGYNIHRGVLAAGTRRPPADPASLIATSRSIALLDAVNDHENLGVIFRSAAAFGLDAVLLSAQCSDPLYRRCLRVSMGHALDVPFAWIDSTTEAIDRLQAAGFTVIGLSTSVDAVELASVSRRVARDKTAIVAGSEASGLADSVLAAVDVVATIPMHSGVDSLNVAAALSIALYALQR